MAGQDDRSKEGVQQDVHNPGSIGQQINVAGDAVIHHHKAPPVPTPKLPCHNLPFAPNPDFVGREKELADLHRLLAPGTPVALTQPTRSITGLGGVGKTQLALQYAHLHLDDYAQVLWVDASGEDIASAMAELALELGLALPDDMHAADKAKAVRRKLEDGAVRLLVLDNVDGSKSYSPYLPRSGQTRVLITTRRTDLRGVKPMRLDVLPMKQAIELLIGEYDFDEAELQAAEALCVELGRLTLALAVASRMLRPGLLGPSSLLARLQEDGPVELMEGGPEDAVFRKHSSLMRLFDQSVAHLDLSKSAGALALAMLEVGGWFAAAPIPVDILAQAAKRYVDGEPARRPADGVVQLVDFGLATMDEKAQVVFHRLVQAYAKHRGKVDAGRNAVATALSDFCRETAPEAVSLQRLVSIHPHLEEILNSLATDGELTDTWIPLRFAQSLRNMGDYQRSLQVCEQVLNGQLPSEQLRGVLVVAGGACMGMGEFRAALAYFEQCREILERAEQPMLEEQAHFFHIVGEAQQALGENQAALASFRRGLQLLAAIEGDIPSFRKAVLLQDIGRQLLVMGEFHQAVPILEKAVQVKSQLADPTHPSTGSALTALGQAYEQVGEYELALAALRPALEIAEQNQGTHHPETAVVLSSLAGVENLLGNDEVALVKITQAIEIMNNFPGGDTHPKTAGILHRQGQIHLRRQEYGQATRSLRQAWEIRRGTLGEGHQDTAITQAELGRVQHQQGNLSQAADFYQQALKILDDRLGPDHRSTRAVRAALQKTLEP